jgi:hypothetical protein
MVGLPVKYRRWGSGLWLAVHEAIPAPIVSSRLPPLGSSGACRMRQDTSKKKSSLRRWGSAIAGPAFRTYSAPHVRQTV